MKGEIKFTSGISLRVAPMAPVPQVFRSKWRPQINVYIRAVCIIHFVI